MKITKKTKKKFSPISIKLTIDTQRELDAFKVMILNDVSIPNCVEEYKEECEEFLNKLDSILKKY